MLACTSSSPALGVEGDGQAAIAEKEKTHGFSEHNE